MRFVIKLLLVALTIVMATNCGDDDLIDNEDTESEICNQYSVQHLKGFPVNSNSVFPGTELINIPSYHLSEDTLMRGDSLYLLDIQSTLLKSFCCEQVRFFDIVSTEPVIQWEATNDSLVAVAIFKGRVGLNLGGTHINDESVKNVVWSWHSKLPGVTRIGDKLQLEYRDGKNVVNGDIVEDSEPRALDPNTAYAWAVWTWNREGTKVIRSSREIFFLTRGEVSLSKLYPDHEKILIGTWENESRIVSNGELRRITFDIAACSYEIGNSPQAIETQWQINRNTLEIDFENEEYVLTDVQVDCKRIRIEYHSLPNGNMVTAYFKRID